MSNGKGISSTIKPQFLDLPTRLAVSSNKNFLIFSLCKIVNDVSFWIFKSCVTNYYFFSIFLNFPDVCLMINLTIQILFCLNFEIPLMVLISTRISFLILKSQDNSPVINLIQGFLPSYFWNPG